MARVDLTGQVFGRLTVLGPDTSFKPTNSRFKCVCECGEPRSVVASSLLGGRTQSCGCLRADAKRRDSPYPDFIGRRFERLLVLGRVYIPVHRLG